MVQTSALDVMGHSNLLFHEIDKEHNGIYSFSVQNYHLQNTTYPIGSDTTDVTLDVRCKCIFCIIYIHIQVVISSMLLCIGFRWS